jgi:hypothetical protein
MSSVLATKVIRHYETSTAEMVSFNIYEFTNKICFIILSSVFLNFLNSVTNTDNTKLHFPPFRDTTQTKTVEFSPLHNTNAKTAPAFNITSFSIFIFQCLLAFRCKLHLEPLTDAETSVDHYVLLLTADA